MQYNQIIFLIVIVVAFYLLLIRPQQQQAKRQKEMVSALAPGAHILTIGGIYATVIEVADDRLRVAVADGSQLEIATRAVASILPEAAEPDAEEPEDADEEPVLAEQTPDAATSTAEGDSPDA